MQTLTDLDAMVAQVAAASLPGQRIASIVSEPEVDAEGLEGLRVTVILVGDGGSVRDDAALDVIVDLRQALQRAGDDRFPFVDITTESELASDGDLESGSPA